MEKVGGNLDEIHRSLSGEVSKLLRLEVQADVNKRDADTKLQETLGVIEEQRQLLKKLKEDNKRIVEVKTTETCAR